MTRVLLIVSLLASTMSVALPAGAGVGSYRPDSFVKKGGTSVDPLDYVGYLVYNTTGAGQTVRRTVRAGQTGVFTFVARNEGSATDTLYIQGCASDGPVKIRWFKDVGGGGFVDMTSEVAAGTTLPGIGQNVGVGFRMEATVKAKFSGRGTFRCPFYVQSTTSPSLEDVSRAKMPIRG